MLPPGGMKQRDKMSMDCIVAAQPQAESSTCHLTGGQPVTPAARVILCDPPGQTEQIPLDLLLQNADRALPWLQGNNLFVFQGGQGEQLNLSELLPHGSRPEKWHKAQGSLTLSGVTYALYHHYQYEAEFLVQIGMVASFY